MATILIVDDERLLCDLLQKQLRSHGHEAISAYTGREGLALFRQRRPRFTILDLYLPDISGLEVLRKMRDLDPHAGVIVLTGHPSGDLEREARDLGATEFLTKGLKLETVVLVMQEALARPLPSPAPSPRTTGRKTLGASQEPISLLFVDDEDSVCAFYSQYLIQFGYQVRTAQNGPAALALVEQQSPRLIIVDMAMPDMDGVKFVRKLRERQVQCAVIAFTSSRDERLLEEILDLGVVDVMETPADPERLAIAIQVGLILTSR